MFFMECPVCKGEGRVKDKDGVHVCWECLNSGRLDIYSEDVPEPKIKI